MYNVCTDIKCSIEMEGSRARCYVDLVMISNMVFRRVVVSMYPILIVDVFRHGGTTVTLVSSMSNTHNIST